MREAIDRVPAPLLRRLRPGAQEAARVVVGGGHRADGCAGSGPGHLRLGAAGLGRRLGLGRGFDRLSRFRLGQMGQGGFQAEDRAQARGAAAEGGVDGVVGAGAARADRLPGVAAAARAWASITLWASERAGWQPRRIWSAMKAAARQSLSASAISSTHQAICSSWRSRSSSGSSAISARARSSSWKSGWARRASISFCATASTRASLAGDIPPARR